MNDREIYREAKELVDEVIREGRTSAKSWLVHELCKRHEDDPEWHRACAAVAANAAVGRAIREHKAAEGLSPEERQGSLFGRGYEYLQRSYAIARSGESHLVPVDEMTSAERAMKAAELRKMGLGCFKHADELEAFSVALRASERVEA